MFERLSRSWELVKASYAVLRADKELIVFPIVSLLGTIAVMIVFAIPMALAGSFGRLADNNTGIFEYAVAFLFYIVMYTVVIFSNAALAGAALIRLRGGDPTLADGFRIAREHLGQIVGYAVIAATVGVVLRALRERGGLVGQIVAWIGGIAWNLATYLVIPVLVVENIGPIEAIRRSTDLLKRTWGEQIVGNFSIGLVFGLLTLAAILLVGVPLIALAAATGSVVLIVLAIAIVVLLVAAISLIGSALNGIYVAALYRFATENAVVDQYFSPELVQGAFRPK
ncbi:MAG: hypothetical protein EHM39_03345 [Chloroflexi bacterium]|nr:MAG: hypothetical protein EHM39_03345 [Chloroflexota bacterium]